MGHTRTLLLMVGESGSGKSTLAQAMVEEKGYVRLNRDTLRIELAPALTDSAFRLQLQSEEAIRNAAVRIPNNFKGGVNGRDFEDLVAKVQRARAAFYLAQDKTVIIDDTNLNPNTVDKWRHFANHKAAFDIFRVTTPMDECIARDALREGKARVGRAVIERQFLVSGRHPLFQQFGTGVGAKSIVPHIVLFDIDGTVANHMDENGNNLRSPYGENVDVDGAWQPIIDLVNLYHFAGFLCIAVSGRKSTCGDLTIKWLEAKGVHFDAIFMRHSYDNRSDVLVKQDILRELTAMVPKEFIDVIDDRPRVVRDCWMAAGIPVTPVYGGTLLSTKEFTTTHAEGCEYTDKKGYRRCPSCAALEDF